MATPPKVSKNTGEAYVWLASMGLALGLLMVVGLIGLIVADGSQVFWPKPFALLELKPDSKAGMNNTTLIGGVVAKEAEKSGHRPGEATEREWQLFVGNKDSYGLAYKYVDLKEIVKVSYPLEIISIERMEYGQAMGVPVALELKNEGRLLASDPQFATKLATMVDETNERREEISHIEKDQIGKINAEMEDLRLEQKTIQREPSGHAKDSQLKNITLKMEALQAEYKILAERSGQLRQQQQEHALIYRLPEGQESRIVMGQIVSYYYPNQLNFATRVVKFFHNLGRFMVEEPREANTEGGIFPAIFGTAIMTILMSLVVMPFGILAAIYLREYAKEGLFVRSVRIAVNNLAGVPSIVFGVFGLGFFVYTVGGGIDSLFFSDKLPTPTFGTGGVLWAALTLALMTVPVVIVATEESLAAVPRGVREASLACGASKWQTIWRIVLPAAAPGMLTGLILAMARGAGEVAPLMLVGVVKLAPTLPLNDIYPYLHLDQKFMHLGFHIYDLGFQSPDSDAAKPMVFATTFFLILLVVCMNLGAIYIRERLRRKFMTGAF